MNKICIVLFSVLLIFSCGNRHKSIQEQEIPVSDNRIDNELPQGSDDYHTEQISELDLPYIDNSLTTGATPYKSVYGKNYKCPYSRCSGIKVTAPHESDIVVIVKMNNSNGKVIAHGYIQAGGTYKFDVPDGTYQTFFYYGKGWNPNKQMKNGILGGFVKDELFSKDNPQDVYSGVLSYVLQLQRDGNFQTRNSNKIEMF